MLFTPYQAMLMAQDRSQGLLREAEQDRLMQATQDHRHTRWRRPSLTSIMVNSVMKFADQKRIRKPGHSTQP